MLFSLLLSSNSYIDEVWQKLQNVIAIIELDYYL